MVQHIQIINQCTGGTLPVAGGLLDQSAYYLSLKTSMDSDEARIRNEPPKGRR